LLHFIKLNVVPTCFFGWLSQIEKLEDVAGTLEELWISYNQINSLDGLSMCTNLTTLYVSNNAIKAWNELDKLVGGCVLFLSNVCTRPWAICLLGIHKQSLSPHTYHLVASHIFLCLILSSQAGLPNLRDVLFVGNPIYDDMPKEQARIEVLKRLPQVAKIDGDMVKPTERELATGVAAV
jgi:dynein light chain 1